MTGYDISLAASQASNLNPVNNAETYFIFGNDNTPYSQNSNSPTTEPVATNRSPGATVQGPVTPTSPAPLGVASAATGMSIPVSTWIAAAAALVFAVLLFERKT